ncbi:MAG: Fe-S cluster assembly ATPase SufC [Proteobacteria bacterium]|nr:Fe-S cluster assembly ATPase SufC [Pseudomonadota bacterium]
MLSIRNIVAQAGDTKILKGLNMEVKAGEVHAIMGPNGAGKSTLGNLLAGMPHVTAQSGEVEFLGKNLLDLSPEARAAEGVFLAFQYPVEIPGVNNMYFLRTALNAQRKYRGEVAMDSATFLRMVKQKVAQMNMRDDLLKRPVNVGFSGGEKKRNEVFQMSILEPKLAILDETDSGLDIDALKIVADGVNQLRSADRSFIIITHYQRLLDYIKPDFVHVLADGKIVKSGDSSLALKLEEQGYGWLNN